MWIKDSGASHERDADERRVTNCLIADVADIQAVVASLPDLDTRSPEDIIGYDEAGLPQ
ncbi:MAG TPA: hypothetical protein VLK84_28355 [Longimicrobium sp.]|nr:hypothetical protein [Longimicrobium sp.]